MESIDLRSDTVTQPTDGMRRAMADAPVGDDVYGEDPTVQALEERTASILGTESALFVPSGTMANQIALQLHCRAGDEVLCGRGNHILFYECGAGAAYAGVQLNEVGETGRVMTPESIRTSLKPKVYYLARTRLLTLENTHNRGGGRVLPLAEIEQATREARAHGLATHLDGARLWNAANALRRPERDVAAGFDTVSVCFSKGLGAPVGSALAGSRDAIDECRHLRRRMGGAMRQAGILAAGGLYALEHHRERLGEDHVRARRLASRLHDAGFVCDVDAVETNIVAFEVAGDAQRFSQRAAEVGVLAHAIGPRTLRAVTHLNLTDEGVGLAGERLATLAAEA